MTMKEVHRGFKGYGKIAIPLRTVYHILMNVLIEAQIKDNKDQSGCSIDDFCVLNRIKLYLCIQ